MLPKPITQPEKPDDRLRAFMFVKMIDALTDDEKKAFPYLKNVLDKKIEKGKRQVEIPKVLTFLGQQGCLVTEMMVRRMINKYEWEYKRAFPTFEILYGHEWFKASDQVRASQIQEGPGRASGKNRNKRSR